MQKLNIAVIGDTGAGKTSILAKIRNEHFNLDEKTTIGVEFMRKEWTVGSTVVSLQFWDTPGQQTFKEIARIPLRKAQAAFVVCDISKPFDENQVRFYLNLLAESAPQGVIKMLLCNKVDLLEENKQLFPAQQVQQFCRKENMAFETVSAKQGRNISKVLNMIAKEMLATIEEDKKQADKGVQLLNKKKKDKIWRC